MRTALVLGGGGVPGMAYHAAVLAALENDLGWDARRADVIVGTSAGAIVGSLLRVGLRPMELAGLAVGSDIDAIPTELARRLREPPSMPHMRMSSLLRWPRLPSHDVLVPALRRMWRIDPVEALISMLPEGTHSVEEAFADLAEVTGSEWPADDLWLCALRQRDHRRVVFGRDVRPPLPTAIAASCCIPSCFQPVTFGETRYLDGGVRSPTNADVLRERSDLDLVIIVSPMSGRGIGRVGLGATIRRHARAKVRREQAILRAAGLPSVVLEPDRSVVEALGTDFLSNDRVRLIMRAAFLDTGDQLQDERHLPVFAQLATRSRRSPRVLAALDSDAA